MTSDLFPKLAAPRNKSDCRGRAILVWFARSPFRTIGVGFQLRGGCAPPEKLPQVPIALRNRLRHQFSSRGPGQTGKIACMEPRSLVGRKPQPLNARDVNFKEDASRCRTMHGPTNGAICNLRIEPNLFLGSRKRDRVWTRAKDGKPSAERPSRKARKRGGKATKRGLSDEQVPVLVATDRSGTTVSAVLPGSTPMPYGRPSRRS